jgi:hypothetical protein
LFLWCRANSLKIQSLSICFVYRGCICQQRVTPESRSEMRHPEPATWKFETVKALQPSVHESKFRIWKQVYLNIWKQACKDLYQPHMYPWPMEKRSKHQFPERLSDLFSCQVIHLRSNIWTWSMLSYKCLNYREVGIGIAYVWI